MFSLSLSIEIEWGKEEKTRNSEGILKGEGDPQANISNSDFKTEKYGKDQHLVELSPTLW